MAPDYNGPPLVSFEKRIADGLGLKLGEPVTVNVLGRNITATIANMRAVDWETLGINFVMVFSPNSFRGAPHTHLATLTYPGGGTATQEAAVIRAVAENFPMVTTVRVKDALEAVGSIIGNLVLAIRGASAITLDRRCAGARRRTGGRPPIQGLRCGDPQDAGCHASRLMTAYASNIY